MNYELNLNLRSADYLTLDDSYIYSIDEVVYCVDDETGAVSKTTPRKLANKLKIAARTFEECFYGDEKRYGIELTKDGKWSDFGYVPASYDYDDAVDLSYLAIIAEVLNANGISVFKEKEAAEEESRCIGQCNEI